MKKLDIAKVIGDIVFIIAAVFVIYTLVQFCCNFGYSPELGIYDTRCYSFTIGDYILGKGVTYEYTNLNILDVLARIY